MSEGVISVASIAVRCYFLLHFWTGNNNVLQILQGRFLFGTCGGGGGIMNCIKAESVSSV